MLKCFLKPKDIQFTVTQGARKQKVFTFKKLKYEDLTFHKRKNTQTDDTP